MNYAVIQSFPPSEKSMAFEVAEFLNSNGVRATVEENVSGYSGWYVVMGLEGFHRPSSDPAYKQYESKIRELSIKYAKEKSLKRASFKRFDSPLPRAWQGTERTASAN